MPLNPFPVQFIFSGSEQHKYGESREYVGRVLFHRVKFRHATETCGSFYIHFRSSSVYHQAPGNNNLLLRDKDVPFLNNAGNVLQEKRTWLPACCYPFGMVDGEDAVFKVNVSYFEKPYFRYPQSAHINHAKENRHNQVAVWTFTTVSAFVGFSKELCQLIDRINIRHILFFCRIIPLWKDIGFHFRWNPDIFQTGGGWMHVNIGLPVTRMFFCCTNPIRFPL